MLGDARVQHHALGFEHALVGGVVRQCALEEVAALGQASQLTDKLRTQQVGQGTVQRRGVADERAERIILEVAADHGRVLQHRLGGRGRRSIRAASTPRTVGGTADPDTSPATTHRSPSQHSTDAALVGPDPLDERHAGHGGEVRAQQLADVTVQPVEPLATLVLAHDDALDPQIPEYAPSLRGLAPQEDAPVPTDRLQPSE